MQLLFIFKYFHWQKREVNLTDKLHTGLYCPKLKRYPGKNNYHAKDFTLLKGFQKSNWLIQKKQIFRKQKNTWGECGGLGL